MVMRSLCCKNTHTHTHTFSCLPTVFPLLSTNLLTGLFSSSTTCALDDEQPMLKQSAPQELSLELRKTFVDNTKHPSCFPFVPRRKVKGENTCGSSLRSLRETVVDPPLSRLVMGCMHGLLPSQPPLTHSPRKATLAN